MKTIGLVGGISWYSTVDYYRYINQIINERLGGSEAAQIIINSVNYGDIIRYTRADDWKSISVMMCDAARAVERAGADCLLLGANTMHHIADDVAAAVNIPLLHIADAVADSILSKNISTVALLGTRYTMQFDFYKKRLSTFGIKTIIPGASRIDIINDSIYEELGKGLLLPATKQFYLDTINELTGEGAEGIVLGCTEIPLLIKQEDSPVPVFDTTFLHANAAVNFALA